MVKEFISQLPPDKLSPFAKHPYRVQEDAAMDELVESVRTHGILSPLLARPQKGRAASWSAGIGGVWRRRNWACPPCRCWCEK